jgi:hypothetical protein
MKTVFNTATSLIFGTFLLATVSGRHIRVTIEQGRRGQEVEQQQSDLNMQAADGGTVGTTSNTKISNIRPRPETPPGGLSRVFDEFHNWKPPADAEEGEVDAKHTEDEAETKQEGGKNGMKWKKKKTITEGETRRHLVIENAKVYARGTAP